MILLLLLLTTDGRYDEAGFPGTRPASSRGLLGAQFATYITDGQTIQTKKYILKTENQNDAKVLLLLFYD
jgi:hypothetical protein